ncbi:MAG TPA: hypothetical protein VFE65_28695 [Pseudonocardia sp.]|nr:hypothetical protein [Pseudonocardia sp.]
MSGVLLSLVLAAMAFCYFPLQYASSATAVLVPPKLPSSNPMLEFSSSVNMTTLVLVQALNSPEVANRLGITPQQGLIPDPGLDSYTVKNVGSVDLRDDGNDRPFITVTAQSLVPDRSEVLVAQVLDEARQQLKDRQLSMNVSRARSMQLEAVVGPVPAKAAPATSLKAIGIALVLGLIATVSAVCLVERNARRRPGDRAPARRQTAVQSERLSTLMVDGDVAPESLDHEPLVRSVDVPTSSHPAGVDAAAKNGRPRGFERAL